jgi:hypothetical protein
MRRYHLATKVRFQHLRNLADAAADNVAKAHIAVLESELRKLREDWIRYYWVYGEAPKTMREEQQ